MPVTQVSLGGGSNPGRDTAISAARFVNCYAEDAGAEGKIRLPVYACDGFDDWSTLPFVGATRAMLSYSNDALYVVSGTRLFKVTQAGAATEIGFIPVGDRVTMARNGRKPLGQIGISAGGFFTVVDNDVTMLIDLSTLDSGPLVQVIGMDGFFVLLMGNGEFFLTSLQGVSIDPLDFAQADRNPDDMIGGARRGSDLVLFGSRSTEFWRNTGVADFPYEYVETTNLGCYAAGSIGEVVITRDSGTTDSVIWAATDPQGAYVGVMLMDGYGGARVSTQEIDTLIQNEPDPIKIRSFVRTESGRTIYTITGASWTRSYDLTVGLWHDRHSKGMTFWRAVDGCAFGSKIVLGDYAEGKLYLMQQSAVSSVASRLAVRHSKTNGDSWSASREQDIGGESDRARRFKLLRMGQTKEDGALLELKITNAIREGADHVDMVVTPPHVHAWPNPVRLNAMFVDVVPGSSLTNRPKAITGLAVDIAAVKG